MVFTFGSGVAIEAAMLGIPAFACHSIAADYFRQEHTNKTVYVCSREDESLSWAELEKKILQFITKVDRAQVDSQRVLLHLVQ
jgi:hypothetical protein